MMLESSLKTKHLCIFTDTPGSGYLFSCFITGLRWYKIKHEKRINKVLFPCVDTLPFGNFGTAGTILETGKVIINHFKNTRKNGCYKFL